MNLNKSYTLALLFFGIMVTSVEAQVYQSQSQTPGTAVEYALAVVEVLRGKTVAREISDYFIVKA